LLSRNIAFFNHLHKLAFRNRGKYLFFLGLKLHENQGSGSAPVPEQCLPESGVHIRLFQQYFYAYRPLPEINPALRRSYADYGWFLRIIVLVSHFRLPCMSSCNYMFYFI